MIVVTGATGLVGGHLVWHLLQANNRVTAIRRKTSNPSPLRTIFSFYTETPDIFLSRIDWIEADMLDEKSVTSALKNAGVVYHCAAVVSLGSTDSGVSETNVRGTRNIVAACLANKVNKLCFVSSIAACGKTGNEDIIDENAIWIDSAKQSAYSRSKHYSEQEVWKGIEKGLNSVIVNPGVILGVSGTDTGSSELVARVQKGLIFYTDGGSGYVDVQDVVRIMIRLMNSEITAERFILVAQNCSNREILSAMARGFQKPEPFIGVDKQILVKIGYLSEFIGKLFKFKPLLDSGTVRSATSTTYYSSAKIQKLLDYKFNPIEKCINEICQFRVK